MSTEKDREPDEWPPADSKDSAALEEDYSPFEEGDDAEPDYHGGEEEVSRLEARAILAAEHALAAGQQALEAAHAAGATVTPQSPVREWVLRGLLVFNLLLMAAVLLLPDSIPSGSGPETTSTESGTRGAGDEDTPAPVAGEGRSRESETAPSGRREAVTVPETDDRYARAMLRAASGDLPGAVEDLEQYLAAEPHMHAAMKRNVLGALAHYSFKLGLEQRAREFERRAAALTRSHYLPEDLVMMARRAEEEGDGERMRRLYARFLLQQKQVPPSMHRFLAEAYLKLGDSYRVEATRGARRSEERRSEELQPVTPDRGRDE